MLSVGAKDVPVWGGNVLEDLKGPMKEVRRASHLPGSD